MGPMTITPDLPYGYKMGMKLIYDRKPAKAGDSVYIKGWRWPRLVVMTYLDTFIVIQNNKHRSIPWTELDTSRDYNWGKRCTYCKR